MKNVLIFCILLVGFFESRSQGDIKSNWSNKFYISAGYGLAGSFFLKSFAELPELSNNSGAFYKKNFIGNAKNFAVGYLVGKNLEVRTGINFQHFTRRIKTNNTQPNISIYLDKTIHHRDRIYFASLNRALDKRLNHVTFGLGLYYLRALQQTVEYGLGTRSFYIDQEAEFDEGGAFVEFAYEYKFQPKVNLGIRTQFYYTISTGEAESITLFPFVKIRL